MALQALFEGILNKMKEVDEVSVTVSTLVDLDGKLPFWVARFLRKNPKLKECINTTILGAVLLYG